jgi:hypothetical protein
LERLEDRVTPAGNVLASQAGTTLTLTGDELDNSVLLLPGGAPNEIVVQGVGTTVNGSSDPQTFTGLENVIANMNGGNDQLTADGIVISGGLVNNQFIVDGGAGDDRIELLNSTIHSCGAVD